ncbi:MAG: beta-propeller fold lactonase family protein, partial [Chloroflexi bacterium]|nr:beta-propeller fold lactonase family protein [Chloroflexota bacterium]
DKILRFVMDPADGRLTQRHEIEVSGGPAPLALDPERRRMYVGRRGERLMSSFDIDPDTGDLTMTGTVPLEGEPNFVATDRKGNFVFSSYYFIGKVAVHPLDESGALGGPAVHWLDTATGAHSIQADASNRFVFVPHIENRGPNAIFQFRFDEVSGELTPNDPSAAKPEGADGPRFFFLDTEKYVFYTSNEQGCSVTAWTFDRESGTLAPVQTVSTLPADFDGHSTCSQIQITPSGRFLFAPNRGHNSVASFAIDETTGLLTATGRVEAEPVPRAFGLDPSGSFVFASGLESGRLTSYRVDDESGTLTPLETYDVGETPMWVLPTTLP